MKQNSPWYRADIEGLRGIAVLGVVFFHFGYSGFRGGILGVDIFFVISGFLITSLILREVSDGTFSLSTFWARRMRRILPAVTVLMLAVSLYMYAENPPFSSFDNIGEAITAQSFFVSNHYFLSTLNLLAYTQPNASSPSDFPNLIPHKDYIHKPTNTEQKPLTHTWSLSVEEQFYLLFPALLVGLLLFSRKKAVTGLAIIGILSFIFYFYLAIVAPGKPFLFSNNFYLNMNAAFYTLPARAWELLVGALLVFFSVSKKSWGHAMSLVGLLLVMVGMVGFDINSANHGRIIFVTGAALIIAGNTGWDTFTKEILSWKPLVWAGTISYSLYLWHWPIYQLYLKSPIYDGVAWPQSAALIVISVITATFSYEFVEKPFLKKRDWKTSKVLAYGFAAMLLTAAIGLLITLNYT